MNRIGILLGVLLSIATGAWAQLWTITTADFQRRDEIIDRFTPAAVELRGGASLKWDGIVSLEQHAARPARSADPFVLFTRDGQRVAGSPVKMDDESLTWRSGTLGEMTFALQEVRGWSQGGTELPAESAQEDLVVLQNGDAVRGIVEGEGEGVTLVQGNASTPLKWDAIRSVALTKMGEVPAGEAALRLQITDGSVLLASAASFEGERIQIQKGQDRLSVPATRVVSIQNEAGRVRFWTSLMPWDVSYTPYTRFAEELPQPFRQLEQVSIAGQVYRDVIQLRPKTTMSIKSPASGKLHLQYAAGNAGRFTNMDLRVLVGDSVVHETKGISAGQPSSPVEAPVKEGDVVQLELDYGQYFDVQDFLWLINAAFVKS